jgi:RIO-like serine/threonine protein kinase
VLAIDEIEWLIPTGADGDNITRATEYVRLFGLLRSLKQEYGEPLGIILCGINETFTELHEVEGLPNPSLDWYKVHYVSLLSRGDTAEMLRELGRRMGLGLSDAFLDLTWRAFGGHAYLARQFCSEVARRVAVRPHMIDAPDFHDAYKTFIERAAAPFKAIVGHLAKFYPSEYTAYAEISRKELKKGDSSSLRHLRSYGLLTVNPKRQYGVTMTALAEFVAGHSIQEANPERFKLLKNIGHGTSAAVWRAWDTRLKRQVAVKLYYGGTDQEQVDKEFRLLKVLACKYVPQAYERTTVNEQSALVMEYVEGEALDSILRRGVLGAQELAKFSRALFDAIASLHPNQTRIASLKKKSVLTSVEWKELQMLLEGGYLHRDIKPANIIVRDPLTWDIALVDLQLAKPASTANLTLVGTPAYLPPDHGATKWDASFDLYAAACTLFECAFGRTPGNAASVAAQVATRVPDPAYRDAVDAFFAKALNAAAVDRYRSVEAMRLAFDDVLTALT